MSLYRRNIINVTKNTNLLPSEYQQVEYLNSTGTQYLSIPISAGVITYTLVEFTSYSSAFYQTVFGGWLNSTGQGLCLQQSNATSIRFWLNGRSITSANCNLGKHLFETNGTDIYLDGVSQGVYTQDAASDIDTVALFAYYRNDNSSYYPASMIIHHFALKMGTTDIDLYPCYRKSDNEAGMYDVVNRVFYSNAGSGTFLIGPEV